MALHKLQCNSAGSTSVDYEEMLWYFMLIHDDFPEYDKDSVILTEKEKSNEITVVYKSTCTNKRRYLKVIICRAEPSLKCNAWSLKFW